MNIHEGLEICCREKGELRRKIWQAEFKYSRQKEKRERIVKKLQELIFELCIKILYCCVNTYRNKN